MSYYQEFASGPIDDARDLQQLYETYKTRCSPLFLGAENVKEMENLTFEKIQNATDEETLDDILNDVQNCLVRRLEHHQSYGEAHGEDKIDENHLHVITVLQKLWRWGNARKRSMSHPMIGFFIENAVRTFGVEHAEAIRRVAVIISERHDAVCAQYGVDPNTRDDEELNYVAESLVSGFLSLEGSDGDQGPVTLSKYRELRGR